MREFEYSECAACSIQACTSHLLPYVVLSCAVDCDSTWCVLVHTFSVTVLLIHSQASQFD